MRLCDARGLTAVILLVASVAAAEDRRSVALSRTVMAARDRTAVASDASAFGAPEGGSALAAAASSAAQRTAEASRFGLLLAPGLLERAKLSAVFLPVEAVRFFCGPAWNYVGWGMQGGLALTPWRWRVRPVFSGEGGRFSGANLSFLTGGSSGLLADLKPLLVRTMTYTFASVMAGLELGTYQHLTFSIDLGVSYFSVDARGPATRTASTSEVAASRNPLVQAMLPTVRLGLHRWF
jgi:hypothetical protein